MYIKRSVVFKSTRKNKKSATSTKSYQDEERVKDGKMSQRGAAFATLLAGRLRGSVPVCQPAWKGEALVLPCVSFGSLRRRDSRLGTFLANPLGWNALNGGS